jgi:hypothetical protein
MTAPDQFGKAAAKPLHAVAVHIWTYASSRVWPCTDVLRLPAGAARSRPGCRRDKAEPCTRLPLGMEWGRDFFLGHLLTPVTGVPNFVS